MSSDSPIHGNTISINTGNITDNSGTVVVGTDNTVNVSWIDGSTSTHLFVGVPPRLQAFVGREAELAVLRDKLGVGATGSNLTQVAISALEGKPGVGKTALATAIAYDRAVLSRFSGGVLWAGLGQTPNIDEILNSWAAPLHVDLSAVTSTTERVAQIQDALGERPFLIILDDVWKLEDADPFLDVGGPGCVHLLTTRDQSIAQEFASDADIGLQELDEQNGTDLLALLCPAVKNHYETLLRLVRAVGGLPLALTLIGGYLRAQIVFSQQAEPAFAALAKTEQWLGLKDRKRRLELNKVIGLSVDALPSEARLALLSLASFAPKPASFSLAAAEQVSGATTDSLAILVRRNLLEQRIGQAEQAEERVILHQTIAAVAVQRAVADKMLAEAQERHARYYLDLMNKDPQAWQRIEIEWPQIQQAWAWVSNQAAEHSLAPEYISAARDYQSARGLWFDRIRWCERGLAVVRANGDPAAVASLLVDTGRLYAAIGEQHTALEYYEQAVSIYQATSDQVGQATAFNCIGEVHHTLGELSDALNYYQQALPIRQQVHDQNGEADTLTNIGRVYALRGDKQKALGYYQQALPLVQKTHNQDTVATILNNMGLVYSDLGDKEQALTYFQQVLLISQGLGDRAGEARALNNIGLAYSELGDKEEALSYFQQTLPIVQQIGERAGEATTLNNIGVIYSEVGNKQQTLAYFQQSLPISRQVGDRASEARTLGNIGALYFELGDIVQALDYYKQALALSQQVGFRNFEGMTFYNLGEISAAQGNLAEAYMYLEQALAIGKEVAQPLLTQAAAAMLAELDKQQQANPPG